MPTYTFICDTCECKFEKFFYIKDYDSNPKCIDCNSKKTRRSYSDDLCNVSGYVVKSDDQLKTIGDLANRNRDRISDDRKIELYNKHNSYKETPPDKPLPKGMSRIKKPKKIKWTQS